MALTVHHGESGEGVISGQQVLEEICDLIAGALPRMAPDDVVRPYLARALPQLSTELGRSPVRLAWAASGSLEDGDEEAES
jgi:hypothetical protein